MTESSGWRFWSADFWGKARVRGLSTADKMRFFAVIDAANVLNLPEISDAVIRHAATQLQEKPSQIREVLGKLAGMFKTTPDGTPYLGKVKEKLRKREPQSGHVPRTVPEGGVIVGAESHLRGTAVPSEKPNKSAQSARTVRVPLSGGTSLGEGKVFEVPKSEVQGKGSLASPPSGSRSRVSEMARTPFRIASPRNGNDESSGDTPLEQLASRCRGLVSADQWEVALAGDNRDASSVIAAWDGFVSEDGGIEFLLDDAAKKPKDGRALATHILSILPNVLSEARG